MNNTRPNILLVDDEPNLLHSLARALRHEPFHTYTARSAEEALDILKSHPVALVVTDERMQGMCGSELVSWIADNCPEVVRIVLTGQPSVPSMQTAINRGGVFRYFTKPTSDQDLAAAIREGLELRPATAS